MSLLESICCPKHHLRTALVWDDPFTPGPPCFLTYSDLLKSSQTIALDLSSKITSGAPIALYGRSCPQVITAVLAVMSLQAPGEKGGVACLPVNLAEVAQEQGGCLRRCGVELILVELSGMEVSCIPVGSAFGHILYL